MPQDFFMDKKSYAQRFSTLLAGIILPFNVYTPLVEVLPASASKTPLAQIVEVKELDPRIVVLRAYLDKHNSPLEPHAEDFIDAADEYGVDWKLVPAITGVESTFGKHTPGNALYPSYNGWGWGVYGTQALYFKSWRDGIFTVTKGLKENYINKGLTEPYSINRVYAASPVWGSHVTFFINDLTAFERGYKVEDKLIVKYTPIDEKTAGVSAQLALK